MRQEIQQLFDYISKDPYVWWTRSYGDGLHLRFKETEYPDISEYGVRLESGYLSFTDSEMDMAKQLIKSIYERRYHKGDSECLVELEKWLNNNK